MMWSMVMYEYLLTREKAKKRRVPEELEYVEMLE